MYYAYYVLFILKANCSEILFQHSAPLFFIDRGLFFWKIMDRKSYYYKHSIDVRLMLLQANVPTKIDGPFSYTDGLS